MSTSQTLALIGFPPNEMSAFKALFRLAARTGTGYVLVEQAQEAEIVLANADDAETVRRLRDSQPRARVLLIGPSDHGTGWLVQRRPIQLLTVLDAVRVLGAAPAPASAPVPGFAPTMPFEPSTQPGPTTEAGPLWDGDPASVPPPFAATEPFAPLEMPVTAAGPDSAGFAPTQPYTSKFPPTQPYTSSFPATEPYDEADADVSALRAVFANSMPASVDTIDPASIALWREARRVKSEPAPAATPTPPALVAATDPAPSPTPTLRQSPSPVPADDLPAAAVAPAPLGDDVLVVDAGDNSRRTLERYLHQHGLGASAVRSRAEAMDRLGAHSYRLVFVNEPVADASVFQVCRAVRRRANANGSRPTVILVLSSRRGWWDRWRARLAGCDVCLVRPFGEGVLAAVLARFAGA
jgi:CheY-like chemotaxis protein